MSRDAFIRYHRGFRLCGTKSKFTEMERQNDNSSTRIDNTRIAEDNVSINLLLFLQRLSFLVVFLFRFSIILYYYAYYFASSAWKRSLMLKMALTLRILP